MGPNLDSCALARGNLRVCGGSNFSSFDRQAPDHRTVQSWDETVSCAVSGMTALRPVIVVRSSVQKPATSASATVRASIAQRLQQQPPNSFLVGNTMLRQDDRSEGLFKQNPVGRPYPADHVVSLWMRQYRPGSSWRSARRRLPYGADRPAAPGSSTPLSCPPAYPAGRAAPPSSAGRMFPTASASGGRGGDR